MNRFNGLGYAIVVFAGVVLGLGSVPFLNDMLGSDFSRIGTIIEVLNSEDYNPDVVVLGNSTVMSSIDGRRVMDSTKIKEVYNLSSTGQSFMEGSLLIQEVPEKVKLLVHFVPIYELFEVGRISDAIARNYMLSDYVLDEETEQRLKGVDLNCFERPIVSIYADHRAIITNWINRSLRSILRKDLNIQGVDDELYYPNTYTRRLEDEKYKSLVDRHRIDNIGQQDVDDVVIDIVKSNVAYLKKKGVDYLVVLSPINPDIISSTHEVTNDIISRLRDDLECIDFTNVLTSSQYVDHYHPSVEGAKVVSDTLSHILNTLY